jgi:hypothetical protein
VWESTIVKNIQNKDTYLKFSATTEASLDPHKTIGHVLSSYLSKEYNHQHQNQGMSRRTSFSIHTITTKVISTESIISSGCTNNTLPAHAVLFLRLPV